MANAVATAPLPEKESEALNQKFSPDKRYVFRLVGENPVLEHPIIDMVTKRPIPHKKYKPFQNLIFTSQIVWNGKRVNIRYYDGCDTLFVSEQPKEKDVVDQYCLQTRRRNFLEGKLTVEGIDSMLLLYLSICSWNCDSPFRTRTANQIFIAENPDKEAARKASRMDKIEEAMALAKKAVVSKMMVHANFLGIPMQDYDSGNDRSEQEIRTAYREEASRNPEKFIESYGDKTLEIKYYIDKALETGVIKTNFTPNKATWGNSNTEICDIYGLISQESISQRLFEFSQMEEGEDFKIQLKAVSEG